ncbi:MAG TPA: TetR/AcrR family transcriptional regulator [Solimonas sp.]|nr:TetR/AcrR family transcriptional regulator [Solimonas sp.]
MRRKKDIQRRSFRGVAHADRQQQRREQLLEAGLQCFGTRGYHETTVRQVCAEARLTERYFYESFKDREALVLAVYEAAVQRLRTQVLEALGNAPMDAMAVTRAGLGALFRFLHDDRRAARILMVEVLSVGQEADRLSRRVTLGFGELMQQLLELLFPDAARRHGLDPALVSTGLLGASIHIAMRWTLNGFKEPLDDVLAASLSIHEAMIQAWGTPAPAKDRARSAD